MAPTMALWYRRKFNLTHRDPRFLELTPEDIEAEYYAHQMADKPSGVEEFSDDDFNVDDLDAAMADGGDWEDVIRE